MSLRKFYRLLADLAAKSRWYLKSPLDPIGNEVDPRLFTQGHTVSLPLAMTLPIRRDGDEIGFNFCDFDMVVTPAVVNADLEKLVGSAIQRIPVTVDSRENEFEILNICKLVSCIDESRSLFTKWAGADGRPEKVGEFRMIAKLKIDSTIVNGHHIFRVAGWPIALVISEEVKNLFEASQLSGIRYERVD